MWNKVEVQISVPHGHLTARTWGNPSSYPLLAVHGWLDNANSFEKLVHLLPKDLFIVCLDFSGHGHSSHLGPGGIYTNVIFLSDIKATIEHFGWKKLALMGHSIGGGFALQFACLYPQFVEHLVLLDYRFFLFPKSYLPPTRKEVVSYIEERLKVRPPFVQSKEDILHRMLASYNLTLDSIEILLQRGLKESEDKRGHYYYSYDNRCKNMTFTGVNGLNFEVLCSNIFPNFKGRFLFMYASNSVFNESENQDRLQSFVTIFEKNCSHFKMAEIEGFHHFHMDNASDTAKEICKFLEGVNLRCETESML